MTVLAISLWAGLFLGACGDKDADDSGGMGDGGGSDGGTGDGGGSDDGGSGDGGVSTDPDLDDDGWSVANGDCDDTDPATHPGAADEPYDGLDSDCDGASDFDFDGDGYDSDAWGGEDCDDIDAAIHPGVADAPYDGLDPDCSGGSDFDADGDGADSDSYSGEDCDDADPDVGPDAWERPDDGVDQDCDGLDATFDGLVLAEGERASWELTVSLVPFVTLDVAVLFDTTGSMGSDLDDLDFLSLADEIPDADVAFGFATFDDYNYGALGEGDDRPFILQHQMSTDVDAVQAAVEETELHYGYDAPESSMEALYQLLTGTGYDQDCDGTFDADTDVPPYLASEDDPFGGSAEGAADAASALGTLGGLGFRSGVRSLVFYVTDNTLRDPDLLVSTSGTTPGGCPQDAGSTDVAAAASDLGALLYGLALEETPLDGMGVLADLSGSTLDRDGDGAADPLVYLGDVTDLPTLLAGIADQLLSTPVLDTVMLEPVDDPYGFVLDVSPDPATDIDTATTRYLTFTLTLEGAVPGGEEPIEHSLLLNVVVDGVVVETVSIAVLVPPA